MSAYRCLSSAKKWVDRERMSRTVFRLTLSVLHQISLLNHLWAQALSSAAYVLCSVFSHCLPANTTRNHRWHEATLDLSRLRVLDARCWYVPPNYDMEKFDPRSRPAPMMKSSSQSSA